MTKTRCKFGEVLKKSSEQFLRQGQEEIDGEEDDKTVDNIGNTKGLVVLKLSAGNVKSDIIFRAVVIISTIKKKSKSL